jgi:hypothetical protein
MVRNSARHHRVESWITVGFSKCVAPNQCTPEAHGDITDIATCICGAVQKTNINQQYREVGRWLESNEVEKE